MVHQHKRILLLDLRGVKGGMFAATVTANEASDLILLQLRGKFAGTTR
jgi:hypothetical protein